MRIFLQIRVKLFYYVFLMSFISFVFSSCDANGKIEQRANRAAFARGDIVIGVVYTSTFSNFFLEGVQMAVEDINRKGGILDRNIRTVVYDDKNDPDEGTRVAEKLAANPDVIAVIGHGNSEVAISVQTIYEKAGIVFISYGAKDQKLTKFGGDYTFRNIPTLNEFGFQTAQYVRKKFQEGLRVLVFHERDPSQTNFSDIFKKEATKLGIEIVATRSYFKGEDDFKGVISSVKNKYVFDLIFIAGSLPSAGILIKQLREMDVRVPIIGGDSLDSPDLVVTAGKAAEGIMVPTVFKADYPDESILDFSKRFFSKFSFRPDTWAAQGYDAVSLLANAIDKSASTVPKNISSVLKFTENWNGVTGRYSFTPEGDIVNKTIFFKIMQNDEFVFVDPVQDYESDLYNFIVDYSLMLPLEGTITTIDPGLTVDNTSIEITEQLFLGLTEIDKNTYEAVPELATDWKVSEDGITYTFNLREDVRWTSGEPVTAGDIVWAIRRNIHPDTQAPTASTLLYIIKNAEEIHKGIIKDVTKLGVRSLSSNQVEFTLKHPASYFPVMAGLWIYRPLPGSVIEKYGDKWTLPENIQTNGSYRMITWDKNLGAFLKKNPDYYDAQNVAIPEIRYFVIPLNSAAFGNYEDNWLDVMGSSYLRLPFGVSERYKKDPSLKSEYFQAPNFCTYAYAFNTKIPPTNNELVRKAISAAIDRKLLIETITRGNEQPATTFTRPPAFGAVNQEEGVGITFNPKQAQKWLEEAGYPNGQGFPEIKLMYNFSQTHERIANAIQQFLKHYLNIQVTLEGKDWDTYWESSTTNPPHMYRVGYCGDYPDADNFLRIFHPDDGIFNAGWNNREFAKLIDAAAYETHKEKRKELYKHAERLLCEDVVYVVPIYFEVTHCLVKPRVKGWYHMAIGGQHIRNWYLEN